MMMVRIESGPWSATFRQCLIAHGLLPIRRRTGTQWWFTHQGWKRFGIPSLHFLLKHGYDPSIVAENVPKERVVFDDGVQVLAKEK